MKNNEEIVNVDDVVNSIYFTFKCFDAAYEFLKDFYKIYLNVNIFDEEDYNYKFKCYKHLMYQYNRGSTNIQYTDKFLLHKNNFKKFEDILCNCETYLNTSASSIIMIYVRYKFLLHKIRDYDIKCTDIESIEMIHKLALSPYAYNDDEFIVNNFDNIKLSIDGMFESILFTLKYTQQL